MDKLPVFFGTLLHLVGVQISAVFGIFFVIGYCLALLQHRTHRLYLRTFGWKGILWTAWIGTPMHEFSHLLMAKLFRHKIEHVSLFEPNKTTGGLGHVEHSYHPRSLYQRIGNFFIGAAPMILGALFLWAILFFLHPEGKAILLLLREAAGSIHTFFELLPQITKTFFSKDYLTTWHFWLFLYVSFAIAAHSAPSPQDQTGMWRGFGWIVLLITLVNGIALAFGYDLTGWVLSFREYLGIFTGIFLYTLLLSLAHFAAAAILFLPWRRR